MSERLSGREKREIAKKLAKLEADERREKEAKQLRKLRASARRNRIDFDVMMHERDKRLRQHRRDLLLYARGHGDEDEVMALAIESFGADASLLMAAREEPVEPPLERLTGPYGPLPTGTRLRQLREQEAAENAHAELGRHLAAAAPAWMKTPHGRPAATWRTGEREVPTRGRCETA